ncbi:zinc ABC transporter substrate-binding protein [Nisaea nitritireducens]|uniref:zinc ABC transporter substrate-binding protein n=1 Tax=Nisaea nitritireducens TaxID=568392 RepID=UPI0018680376|nr:zinc ABC transporter substrate-binding protein [Nisaea nitritireducens]
MRYPFLQIGGLFAVILLVALPARAELSVVASIPPVHSLVAKVMAGAGEPHLLLRNGQSPHEYALRPSDARAIENADLIILVSPTIETFLGAAVERNADHDGRVVELSEAKGVTHLSVREGTLWDSPEHDEHTEHGHDEHDDKSAEEQAAHDHGPDDPHVWLSPSNAQAFVTAIAASLAARDPDRAALYHANAVAAVQDLEELSQTIRQKLAPVKDRPFLVFHDAYQYFEAAFDLTAAGAISLGTGAPPGAARLRALRQRVADGDIRCIFREVQFRPRLAEVVAEGSGAKLGTLDPVGSTIPFGPDAYNALMLGLADGFESCLR